MSLISAVIGGIVGAVIVSVVILMSTMLLYAQGEREVTEYESDPEQAMDRPQ